jgi:uncharacterized protein with HEPN domain
MPREVSKLLRDIVQSGKAVKAYVGDKSFEDYIADPVLRDAVERRLFIDGDSLVQRSQIDEGLAERFENWRQIRAFRNLLAHGHFAVIPARIWSIVQEELSATVETAIALSEEI